MDEHAVTLSSTMVAKVYSDRLFIGLNNRQTLFAITLEVTFTLSRCPTLVGFIPANLDRTFDGYLTQASLLHPWIRCLGQFSLLGGASSKTKKSEAKFKRKQRQLQHKSGFVLRITSQSLSCNSRIKKKKSINQSM